MRVEPLTAEHLDRIALQPHQAAWRADATPAGMKALAASSDGWTAVDGERVLASLGVLDRGNGNGEAWGLLAGDCGPAMGAITRAVKRYLTTTPYRRIEIRVAANFPPAKRWAAILGFRFEGVARAYCADGTDAEYWALVR